MIFVKLFGGTPTNRLIFFLSVVVPPTEIQFTDLLYNPDIGLQFLCKPILGHDIRIIVWWDANQ